MKRQCGWTGGRHAAPWSRTKNPNPTSCSITKIPIIDELKKTVRSIRESYTEFDGKVRDSEMILSIAAHNAAIRVIQSMPASSFPLGKRGKDEWH